MVTRNVLHPKAYVGSKSPVIVVGIVHRYVLTPILTREGLVGTLFCEHHRNLRSAFPVSMHREAVAGDGFIKSGADCEHPALIPQIELDTYGIAKRVRLHRFAFL